MVRSVEGIYRNGKVELLEPAPTPAMDESRVIVTFLVSGSQVNLADKGIDATAAAVLRAKLKPIEEDWNRPEMDLYDAL